MNLDVSVNVNQLADELGKVAGPMAQHGWEILVRQQYVIGVQQLILAMLGSIVLGLGIHLIRRGIAYPRGTKYDKEDWREEAIMLTIAGVVASIIGTIAAILFGADAIAHLVNPEYGAIQEIFRNLSKP